jgi:hypothetical protein
VVVNLEEGAIPLTDITVRQADARRRDIGRHVIGPARPRFGEHGDGEHIWL